MYEIFIKTSLIIHVFAGTCALITGLCAMLLKNKIQQHKKAGKLYFWFMAVIFITGLYLSILKDHLFLFYISIFSYYLTLVAYRALKYKQPKPIERIDWVIEIISGIAFLGLVGFAIFLFMQPGDKLSGIIPLTFGIIGLRGVQRNIKRFKNGPTEKLGWKKIHLANMIGSYIAAITAFLVNQSEHIPVHPVILWLGPTVVLVPYIFWELKKVKTIPYSNVKGKM